MGVLGLFSLTTTVGEPVSPVLPVIIGKSVSVENETAPLKSLTFVAEETSNPAKSVFLYQKTKPDPYAQGHYNFTTVCSPYDLVVYPVGSAATNDAFRYCRYHKMIIKSEQTQLVNYANSSIDRHIARLNTGILNLQRFTEYESLTASAGTFAVKLHVYKAYEVQPQYRENNVRIYMYTEVPHFVSDKLFLVDAGNFLEVVSSAQVRQVNKTGMSNFIDVVVPNADIAEQFTKLVFDHITNLVTLYDIENTLINN